MIRELTQQDSYRVLEIYKFGLETRNATFETIVPLWNEWDSKYLGHSRFIYEDNEEINGWVALSPVSTRDVYKGVAEISIYIDSKYSGRGIGTKLMEKVIRSSEEHGIWTLFASVFPENKKTINLHIKFGFRIIGSRERIANLDGVWRDTILLEKRSTIVGI